MKRPRYCVSVNMFEACRTEEVEWMTEMFIEDNEEAVRVFNHFLDNDFRPVRLSDRVTGLVLRSAENGIRTAC